MNEPVMDSEQGTQDQGAPSEESRPRLGANLVESESADSSSPAADGHSEGSAVPKPSSPQPKDWTNPEVLRRAKPDEVPQEYQASYRFVKQQEAAYSRQQQELRRQQEEAQRRADEQHRQLVEALSRNGQGQDQEETKIAAFQRLMADPNLGPEDRKGLQFVHELVQEAAAPVEELRAQNQALLQRLDRLEQGFGQVSQREVEQATQRLATDLQAANDAFGEDMVNQYAGLIRQNIGQIDPRTGEKFTIVSMLELWTGQRAEQINGARQNHAASQQAARSQAARRPSSARGNADTGPLSRKEAEAKLEQIFK